MHTAFILFHCSSWINSLVIYNSFIITCTLHLSCFIVHCGSIPLSFTTLFHTFQICLNITSTGHLYLFTFSPYRISSACVSFPCEYLNTNFTLFQFYSSYLILALPFLTT